MSALHIIAEWLLIVGGGLLVLVIVCAALHFVVLAGAGSSPEPAVRVRRYRGSDGVLRRYTVVRMGWEP